MRTVTTRSDLEGPDRERVRLGGPASYGTFAIVKRIQKIDKTVSLSGKRVLDLGCGIGSYTVELAARAKWTCGLDVLESNLRQFEKPLPRVRSTGEQLPFQSESFDVVTMIEVLEHTVSDVAVLNECFRVLRQGGQLLLFVPNKLYPLESHPCHVGRFCIGHNVPLVSWAPGFVRKKMCEARIYTRRRLWSLARAAGFKVMHLSYIFPPLDGLGLPVMTKRWYRALASRLEGTPAKIFGVSIYAVLEKQVLSQDAIRGQANHNTHYASV